MPALRTKSPEEIDRILLDFASWSRLSLEDLRDLLNISMILDGIRRDTSVVPYLVELYRKVLVTSTPEERWQSFELIESATF